MAAAPVCLDVREYLGQIRLSPARSDRVRFRRNARVSLAILGLVPAYSGARAGMNRIKTARTSAVAEWQWQSGALTPGSPVTLSPRMNQKMRSFRASIRCLGQQPCDDVSVLAAVSCNEFALTQVRLSATTIYSCRSNITKVCDARSELRAKSSLRI